MDFIRRILPDDPFECRKYLSPSTSITLDNEMSGLLWVCYYFICIARVLPGGIQFEIHVNVEPVGRDEDDGNDGAVDDDDDHRREDDNEEDGDEYETDEDDDEEEGTVTHI